MSDKNMNRNNFILIILIILILCIVVFLAWWLFFRADSSEWKVYKDDVLGLEVKYPSNWNLFGNKGDTWTGFSPLTQKQIYEIDARGTNYFPSFDIVKLKAYENMDEDPLIYQKKSLEELFSNRYVTYSITESEIGGLPAILVITISDAGKQTMYWAVGDDKRYNISYDIPSGEEEKYKDIFQEMVNSFSFSKQ